MRHSVFALVAVLIVASCPRVIGVSTSDSDEKARLAFGEMPRRKYAELNRQLGGQLDPLFNRLPIAYQALDYVTDDDTRKTYERFLVAALEDAVNGDVAEAIFANLLLVITPSHIVVEAVVPELGPGKRLHRILDQPDHDVLQRMQRQEESGYYAEPDFGFYLGYLKNHRNEDVPEALAGHMFRIHPQKALYALVSLDYSIPYPSAHISAATPEATKQIRSILLAEHVVSDVLWRQRFAFDIDPSRLSEAKQALFEMSRHKKWWVRLYVAEILNRVPAARTPEMVQRLKGDPHRLVREAISREVPGQR